uniref:Uncharacterized protein n=1 Tax=Lepeophtheirus salmonis TaxID=72036 RepID=A0A0K2T2X6_LEPSM
MHSQSKNKNIIDKNIEQRRAATLELSTRGKSPSEMSKLLSCNSCTVYRVTVRSTPKASTRSSSKPK